MSNFSLPISFDYESTDLGRKSERDTTTTKRTTRNLLEPTQVADNAATDFLVYTIPVNTFDGGMIPTSCEIVSGNVSNRFKVNLFNNNVQVKVDNAAALAPGGYSVDLVVQIAYALADVRQARRVRVAVQVA